jgi:hypothetical protein
MEAYLSRYRMYGLIVSISITEWHGDMLRYSSLTCCSGPFLYFEVTQSKPTYTHGHMTDFLELRTLNLLQTEGISATDKQ